jgi:hypothetical protein
VAGPFRGDAAIDPGAIAGILNALRALADAVPEIAGIDLNPVIAGADGVPIAVDALIVLS